MGYLEEFGWKIFRLKDERAEQEWVLYNIKTQDYSTLNQNRLISILELEFKERDIDLRRFAVENLSLPPEIKIKNLLKTWVEEETTLLNSLGFRPVNELTFEKHNKKYFNTFNFLETLERDKYRFPEPIPYEEFREKAPYHYQLLYNLHNKDDKAVQDTLLKIADKLRHPDKKAQDCIIFYPGEGAGKGIFYKYVLLPLFGKYANKVLMSKLNNDFNAYMRDSLVLVIEEGKRDIKLVEVLKEMITESQLLINSKGSPQREEEVYFLTFVFSNHMNPIDLGKRRGSYHITHSLGRTPAESQNIGKEICDNIHNESEFLLQYLHSLDFTHQEAQVPYNTKAKQQVTDLNKTPIELFYDYLISYDSLDKALLELNNLRNGNYSFEYNIETYKSGSGHEEEYISKDTIRDAYNNFCSLEGLKSNIIRHNKDIVQLWALMKIPEASHQRIVVKKGSNEGRKIDHIRLRDLQNHIREANQKDE